MKSLGVLSTVLLLFLFSCSNDFTNTNVSYKEITKVEPVQVNFMGHWLGEGKKEQLLKEFVTEFEFVNQDIKVNMVYPEHIYFDRRKQDVEVQFNTEILKKEKPSYDILRFNGEFGRVGELLHDPDWTKKYLVDFSEIPEFTKNVPAELLSERTKSYYGGIIPGPLNDGYDWVFWCNAEVAKKIGIQVKQFGMTSEDLLGYFKAVYTYNQSHNDHIIGLYEAGNWRTAPTLAQSLFFSEMKDMDELLNTAFSSKKIDAWEKVLTVLEHYSQYHPIAPDWESTTWTETTNYPLDGKCLFYANATWMYNLWEAASPQKLNNMLPTEMPVFNDSHIYIGGYQATWGVLKNSPHKDQAIRLLLALNTPDFAEKWVRYTKSPIGIKGNLTSVNFGFDKFEDYEFYIRKKYGENKTPVYNTSSYYFGSRNEKVYNNVIEVLTGKKTAAQAMSEIKRAIKR
jgi:hypothetical protein